MSVVRYKLYILTQAVQSFMHCNSSVRCHSIIFLLIVHLVEFLKRCIQGLIPSTGIIIVKENISKDQDDFDSDDSSVTRSVSV